MNEPLTVLVATGSPAEIGELHGRTFDAEIREYMEDRRHLSREGTTLTFAGVEQIADDMVQAHRDYDADLYEEMAAMAAAAGITPGQAIVVGGYTDFIDTVRAIAGGSAVEDTCTSVITPDASSEGAGFLAQTWDMHASATAHVFMLDVTASGAPRSLVFTTHGTLGQIGMNEAGIAVGINNLTVDDGRVGVTWPFAVRKALRSTTFDAAVKAFTEAPLAGGHNFLVFDATGQGVSIEATSTRMYIETLEATPLAHTNHCVVPETQEVEGARPAALNSSSIDRLMHATTALSATSTHTPQTLMALLRDERSICRRPEPPFDYESSGAVIMRPRTGDMWACWGVPADNEFEHFTVSSQR